MDESIQLPSDSSLAPEEEGREAGGGRKREARHRER